MRGDAGKSGPGDSFGDAPGEAGCSPADLDVLYNDIDKLYHGYARECGLSDCAYWMMYDLLLSDGNRPLAAMTSKWAYSKQTINSAIKTLAARGLVSLAFAEGSRKSKVVEFSEEGRAFARRHIQPAVDAERRAFSALAAAEQLELLNLVGRFARALEDELVRMEGRGGGSCLRGISPDAASSRRPNQ